MVFSVLYSDLAAMPRKLRFDIRKGSTRKTKQKVELTTADLKGCCHERPLTADAETQTDIYYHCDRVNSSVQVLVELATVTVGTQTEVQAVETVDCTAQTDDTTDQMITLDAQGRTCQGIADEKYTPLILKCSGVFKDSDGKLD